MSAVTDPFVGMPPAELTGPRLNVRIVSGIKPEPVDWLWRDRVPVGVVTALAGDGGLGKSTLTMHIAAEVTRGRAVGKTGTRRVSVLLCEDSPSAVIRPRLAAAGALLEQVSVVSVQRDGIDAPLVLPDELPLLRQHVQEFMPDLLIVDPVMGMLGGAVDGHRDGGKGGMRSVLNPLHRIAEDTGTTVIAVVHLNKGQGPSGQRIGGSAAIRNAVRNVLMLAPHPDARSGGEDDGRRLVGHEKSNYGVTQQTLEATVVGVPVETDAGVPLLDQSGQPITTAKLNVGDESDVDYRSALTAASSDDGPASDDRTALDEAVDFLRVELAGGPVSSKHLDRMAADAGSDRRRCGAPERSSRPRRSRRARGGWSLCLSALSALPKPPSTLAIRHPTNPRRSRRPYTRRMSALSALTVATGRRGCDRRRPDGPSRPPRRSF